MIHELQRPSHRAAPSPAPLCPADPHSSRTQANLFGMETPRFSRTVVNLLKAETSGILTLSRRAVNLSSGGPTVWCACGWNVVDDVVIA